MTPITAPSLPTVDCSQEGKQINQKQHEYGKTVSAPVTLTTKFYPGCFFFLGGGVGGGGGVKQLGLFALYLRWATKCNSWHRSGWYSFVPLGRESNCDLVKGLAHNQMAITLAGMLKT